MMKTVRVARKSFGKQLKGTEIFPSISQGSSVAGSPLSGNISTHSR